MQTTKKISATATELAALEEACNKLSATAYKVCEARSALVDAGCGTFQTMPEYKFLSRLEERLDRIRARLQRKVNTTQVIVGAL
jgi:hypothetical protein